VKGKKGEKEGEVRGGGEEKKGMEERSRGKSKEGSREGPYF